MVGPNPEKTIPKHVKRVIESELAPKQKIKQMRVIAIVTKRVCAGSGNVVQTLGSTE